ncbi:MULTISPECIES: LacI family DNA-binding transcriptional regulator [Rhizobium/Agrobacterium group]|uniref:LacI family DNA-binding transcriptional regulator n=1 Tax=Rhizobium/Agrobacterium group TaxID=227290 RepID=UPI000B3FFE48|nr:MULTISPECIES: LacI family DNA-binding transcriptional regulator [Rhizobium/Agrobacterium group]MCF1472141.1 LacI family DNA-binding transcriptional regulator [Allorhizobium ampelinum]MCF1481023.1 LacI family DNA-binding transcriptional regulator [Allorhizobium ampelinum]NSZ44874.1 substrate-binding domain-containing protein [Agrobacterium vitis]NTA28621.1 substrate-binding domain-containing protein [Allorhizobium ampelinum]OVE93228.1 LacI family transcriptional regulator [Allorhizobium ampe
MKGIHQLAKHLDISIGTVSRALNGRPDVNAETRRRVLEAAEELGYVANQSGRSLRKGTTNVIGLMIESGKDNVDNSDNFFFGVMDGLQTVFARHNLDLVLLPCPADEDPLEYLQRMVARRLVDAMIISATQRVDKRIDLLIKTKIPFVTLGRSTSGGSHTWIDLDFAGVADSAVDRLVSKGHRRIAIAAPCTDINLGTVFTDAYQAALERNGLAFDPALVLRAKSSESGGYSVGSELLALDPRPTAIILIYELMAIGLYRRLAEAGVIPGRDMAVIGFREAPRARFLQPALTCYRLSLEDLGVELAETLLASMPDYAETYRTHARNRLWPLELVPGESDAFDLLA